MNNEKEIFKNNLQRLLSDSGKTQKEVADTIGVSAQTFNTWIKGIAIPRMEKIQKLADYFRVPKSALVDEYVSLNEDKLNQLVKRFNKEEFSDEEIERIADYINYVISKR